MPVAVVAVAIVDVVIVGEIVSGRRIPIRKRYAVPRGLSRGAPFPATTLARRASLLLLARFCRTHHLNNNNKKARKKIERNRWNTYRVRAEIASDTELAVLPRSIVRRLALRITTRALAGTRGV